MESQEKYFPFIIDIFNGTTSIEASERKEGGQ